MSLLLYGCESWLNGKLKPIVKLYNWCLKQLLRVRKNTCNDVCYAESEFPPVNDLVKYNQHRFFYKIWKERSAYRDDPLVFVINTIKSSNTVTGRLITDYISNRVIETKQAMQNVVNSISESDSSRRVTYRIYTQTLQYMIYIR